MKVMTIVGTRPELIRLSRTIALLDECCRHVLVHTGQNYDYELNEVFFKDLGIRAPDRFLGVSTGSLGQMLGELMAKAEEVLVAERPDAVLILGDTNSSLAGILARRMKIPIYHMEAGNRCFDLNVPEEINRKIIDNISDFNLVYTEHARRNLLREGMEPRRIYLSGSPMKEVLAHYRQGIEESTVLEQLSLAAQGYFLASLHREENVDNSTHLRSILDALNRLAEEYGLPVIVSTHPRTRNRMEKLEAVPLDERIRFLKPFGFFDYVKLQQRAFCTLSDSGTISEEAAILGFPAVTIRNSMERPEAMDCGNIVLTGLAAEAIMASVRFVTRERDLIPLRRIPDEYRVEDTSRRVVKLILGTARLSHIWSGILENDLQ